MKGENDLEISLVSFLLGSIFGDRWSLERAGYQALLSVFHNLLEKFTLFTLPIKSKENQNQSRLACMRFPALGTDDVYWLRAFIGSLSCLTFL